MFQIKIYPSKHSISLINEASFDAGLNIPLSYVNLDYSKYIIEKEIKPDFLKSDSNESVALTPVLPGEEIPDENIVVFNKFEEELDIKNLLKKLDDKLYYTPVYEFTPNKFAYSVIIKKNMIYKLGTDYNINVSCVDDSENLEFCSTLSSIMTYPSRSKLLPSNVHINNDDTSVESLHTDYNQADFLFVKSYDGVYTDKEKTKEININGFLNNHVNVWVGCDCHQQYKYVNDDLGYLPFTLSATQNEFQLKRPIFSTNGYVYSRLYFNLNRIDYISQKGKNIYNIFTSSLSPVLIVEHIGKGFEIISHNDVLDNPTKYKDLIFEVMMYVHLISYKQSKLVEEWITYDVPDYEIINGSLYTKNSFSSHIKLNELFDITSGDYSIFQVDMYDINTALPMPDVDLVSTIDNIEFKNVIDNKLVFEMKRTGSDTYVEVEKPVGWTSIYKNGKVYYIEELAYHIESDITNKVFVLEQDNSLLITIYPFRSTKHSLNIRTDLNIRINNIKTDVNGVMRILEEEYIIYYNRELDGLEYTTKDSFVENLNCVELLTIRLSQDANNVFLTDMRQLGGGLREDVVDDYNLLDIGHTNGRPYRQANTLIITMPKKYESHKKQILNALDKYKIGEDYSIVFFEDKEN